MYPCRMQFLNIHYTPSHVSTGTQPLLWFTNAAYCTCQRVCTKSPVRKFGQTNKFGENVPPSAALSFTSHEARNCLTRSQTPREHSGVRFSSRFRNSSIFSRRHFYFYDTHCLAEFQVVVNTSMKANYSCSTPLTVQLFLFFSAGESL